MTQSLDNDASRLIAAYYISNPSLYLFFEGVLTDNLINSKAEVIEFLLEAVDILQFTELVPMELYQETMSAKGLKQYDTEGRLRADVLITCAAKLAIMVGQAGDRQSAREYLGVLLAIKRRTN